MPPLKHTEVHADTADPEYHNLTELLSKTGTKSGDWEPVRQEVKAWIAAQGLANVNFKSGATSAAEDELIVRLGQRYLDHEPNLFGGLDENGIQGTLSFIARRTATNKRRAERRKKGHLQDEESEDDEMSGLNSHASTPSGARRPTILATPSGLNSMNSNPSLKVRYETEATRLLLADIGQSADPPLSLEQVASNVTLATFVQCASEDFGLHPPTAAVWFKFEDSKEPTEIKSDRRFRGAIQEVITGENRDPTFHLRRIEQEQPPQAQTAPVETKRPLGIQIPTPVFNTRLTSDNRRS